MKIQLSEETKVILEKINDLKSKMEFYINYGDDDENDWQEEETNKMIYSFLSGLSDIKMQVLINKK